jgi:hypothetical protein
MFEMFSKFIELMDGESNEIMKGEFEVHLPKNIPMDKIVERDFSHINQNNIEEVLTFVHKWGLNDLEGFMDDFCEYVYRHNYLFDVSKINCYDIRRYFSFTCVGEMERCETCDGAARRNHTFCFLKNRPDLSWLLNSKHKLSFDFYYFLFRKKIYSARSILEYFMKNHDDDEDILYNIMDTMVNNSLDLCVKKELLCYIAKKNYMECAKLFFDKLSITICGEWNDPNAWAIVNGHIMMYEYLVNAGIGHKSDSYEKMIRYAYMNIDTLRYFLKRDEFLGEHVKIERAEHILSYNYFVNAVKNLPFEFMKEYVDLGVDINALSEDTRYFTYSHYLKIHEYRPIWLAIASDVDPLKKVKYLMDHGVEINIDQMLDLAKKTFSNRKYDYECKMQKKMIYPCPKFTNQIEQVIKHLESLSIPCNVFGN